jgi:hypothetical protein
MVIELCTSLVSATGLHRMVKSKTAWFETSPANSGRAASMDIRFDPVCCCRGMASNK